MSLAQAGFQAQAGLIVDASIVQVPIQRSRREENARIKAGEVPEDWCAAKCGQKDVDARWTKKHVWIFEVPSRDHDILKIKVSVKPVARDRAAA